MAKKKPRWPKTIKNEFYWAVEYSDIDIPWVSDTEMIWVRKWWYIGNTRATWTTQQTALWFAMMRDKQRPWDFFYDPAQDIIVFRFADWYSKSI